MDQTPGEHSTPIDVTKIEQETVPVQPVAEMPPMQDPPSDHHKLFHIILIFFIIVLGIVLGVLSYMLYSRQSTPKTPAYTAPKIAAPSPTPTLTDEQEVDKIDVGNVNDDLAPIKNDLNGL